MSSNLRAKLKAKLALRSNSKKDREDNETKLQEAPEGRPTSHETDQKKGKTKASPIKPINELWNEAYEELRLKEDALIKKYERILSDLSGSEGDKRTQLELILRTKKNEVEKTAWKLKFGDEKEVPLKTLEAPVLSIVNGFNNYIGTAMGSTPYTAVAWVGVGLILPVTYASS